MDSNLTLAIINATEIMFAYRSKTVRDFELDILIKSIFDKAGRGDEIDNPTPIDILGLETDAFIRALSSYGYSVVPTERLEDIVREPSMNHLTLEWFTQ